MAAATMSATNNPFEDSFEAATEGSSSTPFRHKTTGGGSGSNPFEDVTSSVSPRRANSGNSNNNPFDDVDSYGNPKRTTTEDFEEDGEETTAFDEVDPLVAAAGAPVEASWQYLGDLPYRRVPIYSNVQWGDNDDSAGDETNKQVLTYGLSAFPRTALQRHPEMLNARELQELLNTSTITKVVGCPYGGPMAAVTLPIVGETSWFHQTEIRILNNAGGLLSKILFPLIGMERKYTPSDIMEIGFTDRTVLVVVLRDSLCLTYNVQGEVLLPPFHILPRAEGKGTELYQATIFEGGAAVLSTSKHAALVEFLDDHDDPLYVAGAHMSARKILPTSQKGNSALRTEAFSGGAGEALPSFCGLVTYLPTAAFARYVFAVS